MGIWVRVGMGAVCASVLLVVSACGPMAREWRQPADRQVSYAAAALNPSAYTGSVVIWGGTVQKARPVPGGMELLIAQAPLSDRKRPDTQITEGDFLARSSQYVNPGAYQTGSIVTLVGEIIGEEKRDMGPTRYTYPVVEVKQLYVWKGKVRPSIDLFSGSYGAFREPWEERGGMLLPSP